MQGVLEFTAEEKREIKEFTVLLRKSIEGRVPAGDFRFLKKRISDAASQGSITRDAFGFNPIIIDLQTAFIVGHEIGFQREIIMSILLNRAVQAGTANIDEIKDTLGGNAANILENLAQINALYAKSPTIETENFRNLLLSFTNDMRVILIMIASRLVMLRRLFDSTDDAARRLVANEASKLYIPLAHKLGFYKLKSEMEDLALRYTETEI